MEYYTIKSVRHKNSWYLHSYSNYSLRAKGMSVCVSWKVVKLSEYIM